jgi:hypothetical protein
MNRRQRYVPILRRREKEIKRGRRDQDKEREREIGTGGDLLESDNNDQ